MVGGMGENNNSTGNAVDVMSVNDLFNTLQSIDNELDTMIKPLSDECRGMEQQ